MDDMKRFFFGIIILSLACSTSKTSLTLNYDYTGEIPSELKKGAKSVYRLSEVTLDVLNNSTAKYTVKEALTVFDKEDKNLTRLVLFYDKFKSIDFVNARIRDNNGIIVKTFSMEDAEDYSASGSGTFFSDNRVKVLDMFYNRFPYTIEYEYQNTYSGLLNLPTWRPQWFAQSIEKATFTLIDKAESEIRYFPKNFQNQPVITNELGAKQYVWNVSNMKAIERESFSPASSEILPQILVAPGKFVIDNSSGDATTWKDFGLWYYELGKDTRVLPEEAKEEINELVAGIESEEKKVKILFDYLQEKSRYVSIQLGIGGWRPFSAEYVYNNSYGDCKALTNYMHAALEHVGIKAESVLIYNGVNEPGMQIDFPSNQFNHVIIRVTLENGDIIWLECTSKYLPPNHIGAGNAGKHALLITPKGGEVIKTPENFFSDNKTERYWRFEIDQSGATNVDAKVKSEGILQDYLLYDILPVSEKERFDWLEETLESGEGKVIEYDFSKITDNDEYAFYSFKAQLNNYIKTSEKRFYIPVNKVNRWRFSISEDGTREQPFMLPYAFVESDSIIIETPGGFEIESAPNNVEYVHPFGEYKAIVEVKNDQEIVYKRHLTIKDKTVLPEDYDELKEFFKKVRAADRQQIVLVRKEKG